VTDLYGGINHAAVRVQDSDTRDIDIQDAGGDCLVQSEFNEPAVNMGNYRGDLTIEDAPVAATGVMTLPSGQHADIDVTVSACNAVSSDVIDGETTTNVRLALVHLNKDDCSGSGTYTLTNNTEDPFPFRLQLTDETCSVHYASDNTGNGNHASAWLFPDGTFHVDINDGGDCSGPSADSIPDIGEGNFSAVVTISSSSSP
jgi:hypothetical protein